MPVKRSLKLDDQLEENSFGPSKITRKRSITSYSPTTGTHQMSPFSSPTSSKKQKHRNRPSNGKRKKLDHLGLAERKECPPKDDEFMVMFSKAEKSLEEIVEIMWNLRSVQALEGNKKLENLLGTSCTSRFLKREVKKTKELLTKVTKQELSEKKTSGLLHKELCHLDSYGLLEAILNRGTEEKGTAGLDFCMCLTVFKGTEEMSVINLPANTSSERRAAAGLDKVSCS